MKYTKLIIIGAPRSGTNMLRDVLTSMDKFSTWPCDEINYIWRYKNSHYISDELSSDMASIKTKKYILKQFDWVYSRYATEIIVEKTCANSLRVPFVDQVVPDAKYLFIHRNGIDVALSASKKWKNSFNLIYLLKKARFVPKLDILYYGYRYFKNLIHQIFSRDKRLAFWGPQINNINNLLINHSLNEVSILQWQRCVEASYNAFQKMDSSRWLEIKYDVFVKNPQKELGRILRFLNVDFDDKLLIEATKNIHSSSVGKAKAQLMKKELYDLQDMVGNTLKVLGYSKIDE